MKWINAEQQVTMTIYDEEHEEHIDKIMTVEEMLDTYINEGCPTIYSNPEQKTGKWAYKTTDAYIQRTCSACGWSERMYHRNRNQDGLIRNYCPYCGTKMVGEINE